MCGILGLAGSPLPDPDPFGRALDRMAHRGPDGRGVFRDERCVLGHRRLAILDLTEAGAQPMTSADGRFVIVHNGEVYNFRELRRELGAAGHRFRSETDTEVVLELFAREGAACFARLRGMFATALWDRRERRLVLARDPMGIKPLYVHRTPSALAFASELRALAALPGGPSEPDPRAAAAYLAWGSVPEPGTLLAGVTMLAPGTWLEWSGGVVRRGTFWTFPEPAAEPLGGEAAREALAGALAESVALRCLSDAPLGAFLSGGIDSSAVVALMRAAGQAEVRTVSVAFPGDPLDESRHAETVARRFGTAHRTVPLTADGVLPAVRRFLDTVDQPTCDGINTSLVAEAARAAGLTVSLSGLGGDELFGGYGTFRTLPRLARAAALVPGPALAAAARAAARRSVRRRRLESLAAGAGPAALYHVVRGLFAPSEARALLAPELRAALAPDWTAHVPYGGGPHPPADSLSRRDAAAYHGVARLELTGYTRNQLLRDSDVFGMAHSLEIRVPLLDHRLVETVFATAASVLRPRRDGAPKPALLGALPSPLPRSVTHRPKMGFTFPLGRWMAGPWRERFERVFAEGSARVWGGVDPAAARTVWREFLDGRRHWSRPWSLLVLARTTGGDPAEALP